MIRRPLPLMVLALLALILVPAAQAGTAAYRMVDLGTLGGMHSCANAINAKGDAVGVSTLKEGEHGGHAVLWSGGKMTDLGSFGDLAFSEANAISDNGVIVGEAFQPSNPSVKRRALQFGTAKAALLGQVSAAKPDAEAYDVNDAGLSVGKAMVGDPETVRGQRAIVTEAGAVQVIEPYDLPNGIGRFKPETAASVNKAGVVVGWGSGKIADKALRRAFRWFQGKSEDPLLAYDKANDTFAFDVNESGDLACGMRLRFDADNPDQPGIGTYQGLIVKGDKVTRVEAPEGYANTELRALNARGDAVGMAWGEAGVKAFLVLNGRTVDPNELLAASSDWKITLLTDINDRGQVVGVATRGKESHAIRLDPAGLALGAAEASSEVTAAATPVTWTTAFAGAQPNPLTGSGTQFAFTLARPAEVTVTLSNVAGRRVRTLVGAFEAGPATLKWDGRDEAGASVGSGVLFAQFAGDGVRGVRKVIVAR